MGRTHSALWNFFRNEKLQPGKFIGVALVFSTIFSIFIKQVQMYGKANPLMRTGD